jgi:GDP/UDP-N,N'-diacetylbacillosamine 2-epimerase (hydrolysing)
MRTIATLTGSRGEWGYIRPILKCIDQDPGLDYRIIATHMHLLPTFGSSVREIERDGFHVDERLHMTFDGYNAVTMTKSLGVLMLELPTVLQKMRPDILLLAGDRGEQLIGAIVGLHLGIPVAHIQAGEISGNVDGIVRHSITKLAHIHFAANEEFGQRVRNLGEQDFRIFVTGAPLVDELVQGQYTSEKELRVKYRLPESERLVLTVQHPVTEEEDSAGEQVEATLQALMELDWPAIFVYPNADAGSEQIRQALSAVKRPRVRMFRNLPRQDYLGLMRIASVMVGNSSSGIMEAPSFGTPTVNIGRRQNGRPQASNVINVGYQKAQIIEAVKQATTPEFMKQARSAGNPYGDGNSSARIVDILKNIPINDELLIKELTY